MICSDEADIALCGEAEVTIHRISIVGFTATQLFSLEFNDNPQMVPHKL